MKKQTKDCVKRNKEHHDIKKRENKILYYGVLYYMMKRDEKK
jgi:hypothetical protein